MTRGDTRRPTQPTHTFRAVYPGPGFHTYVAECSCGWSSKLYGELEGAEAAWRTHRNEAVDREGGYESPAPQGVGR